jgi:hypothetical protein
MKRILLAALPAILAGCATTGTTPANTADDNTLNGYTLTTSAADARVESMTSPVSEVDMKRDAIIARAQACVSRLVTNGAVVMFGGSQPLFGGSATNTDQGGSVIQRVDMENGVLTAMSRVDYRRMLIGYSAESVFIVEAKGGRFRIVQTGLKSLQKSTGDVRNSGYTPLLKRWGMGWEEALLALQGPSDKVADCIKSPGENW